MILVSAAIGIHDGQMNYILVRGQMVQMHPTQEGKHRLLTLFRSSLEGRSTSGAFVKPKAWTGVLRYSGCSLMGKIGAQSRTEALALALKRGLLPPQG